MNPETLYSYVTHHTDELKVKEFVWAERDIMTPIMAACYEGDKVTAILASDWKGKWAVCFIETGVVFAADTYADGIKILAAEIDEV